MNRREALKRAAGIMAGASAIGIEVDAVQAVANEPELNVVALVLKCEEHLSAAAHQNLRDCIKRAFAGTELEGKPVVVLGKGLSLEMIEVPNGKRPQIVKAREASRLWCPEMDSGEVPKSGPVTMTANVLLAPELAKDHAEGLA